jgi:hypothetical protein
MPKPTTNELHFALLRLEDEVGKKAIDPTKADTSQLRRGWLTVPTTAPEFNPDSPIFDDQHPRGRPTRLALNTRDVIGLVGGGARVRYRTNTDRASSGAPCFDLNRSLVTLHHTGDLDYN